MKEIPASYPSQEPLQVTDELHALRAMVTAFPELSPDVQAQTLSEVDAWSDGPGFQGEPVLRAGVKGALLGLQPDGESVTAFYEDTMKPLLDASTVDSRKAIGVFDSMVLYHADMLRLTEDSPLHRQGHLKAISGPGIMEHWLRSLGTLQLDGPARKQITSAMHGFAAGAATPENRPKRMTDLEIEVTR